MSVYSTGVDAYRDTTKWLAAFVPIVSIATAIVVAGPRLVRTIETAPSLASWLEDYWLTLICGIALLVGIAAILTTGAKVLSTEPEDIADLVTGKGGPTAIENAIGSGVTLPEFFDKDEFDAAMTKYQIDLADGKVAKDDPRSERLKVAIEALRDWSVFSRIQGAFRIFRLTFIASAAAIVLALVLAPAQLGSSSTIDKPTAVDVKVDDSGAEDLKASTGCSDPEGSTFYATGGTWDHPEITADGPDCRFASFWYPDSEDIELLAAVSPSPEK